MCGVPVVCHEKGSERFGPVTRLTSRWMDALICMTEDIEALRFNTAISALMEFTNAANKWQRIPRTVAERFTLLLSPLAVAQAPIVTRYLDWRRTS